MGGDAGGGGGGGHASRANKGKPTSRFRSKGGGGSVLMLASMLDILMAILFFLLKNYSQSQSEFSTSKDIQLPFSTAQKAPENALQLVVSQSVILLDDKEIVVLKDGAVPPAELFKDGVTITKLAQELKASKERSLYIEKNNDAFSFTGTLVMQADKSAKFDLIKKVIYTAGISDFVNLKLAVMKKPEG